jgi:hypothetical protein
MNLLSQAQELARRFNQDEAVQQDFEQRQACRALLGSPAPLSEAILDELDWIEALATCRQTRAIGHFVI